MCQTVFSDDTSNCCAVRQPPDAAHHRRHEIEPGRAVLLDQAQRLLGVELDHQHDMRAGVQRRSRQAERRVVIERSGHQHRVAARIAPQRAFARAHRNHAGIAGDDQLGPSGRAAAGRRLPGRRDRVGQIARRRSTLRSSASGETTGRPAPMRRAVADHDRRIRQLDDRVDFVRGQPPRHRLRRRADLPAGELRLDEADANWAARW